MKLDVIDLLENASWPAFIVEAGGTIRRANQAAQHLFGPKLEGESTTLAALWPPEGESADHFLSRWERSTPPLSQLGFCAKGGTVQHFATQISGTVRDGQKRFLFQLFPLPLPKPVEPVAPVATAAPTDASQVQKQRLDCALQLTRTVSMDFNNVLTSILGHTSLVLSKMELAHPFRSSLLEVEKAAQKAAEISQQLAAFSRTEKETPQQQPGNLNGLLRRAVALFQQSSGARLSYGLILDNRQHAVRFDEAKVLQAFVKIIENAREAVGEYGNIRVTSRYLDLATPMNDGTAHLQVGFYVCVEVSDDGPGMAPEVLARAFEPFFTTKTGHRGLGLAWVYGIITNHGGSVAITSQLKEGTSVRVYLPATRSMAQEPTAGKPAADADRQTILMVDDEEILLTMGQAILSTMGYRVLTANSGARALELLQEGRAPIDLLITDLVMPQMSGRELIEQAKILSPGTPVVRISGYVRPNGAAESGTNYLQKPFTSQDLIRHVKQALDGEDAT